MVASLNYEGIAFFLPQNFSQDWKKIRLIYLNIKISQCIQFIYQKELLSCGVIVDTNKDKDESHFVWNKDFNRFMYNETKPKT